MKPMKISGACTVIALAVAMTMATSACASSPIPFGPLFSHSPFTSVALASVDPTYGGGATSPPPFLDPVVSGEIEALMREGIPADRASEAIDVQEAITEAKLIEQMESALGGQYGGIWYVPAAAQLHVGVTSPEAAQTVEAIAGRAGLASAVTTTPVKSSLAELITTQKRWNHEMADLFSRAEVSSSVSPEQNTVKVSLGSGVPDSRRAALGRQALEEPVEVVVTRVPERKIRIIHQAGRCKKHVENEAYCDPPLVAGVTIESPEGVECSAGPAVILQDLTKQTTETFLLTAGHCIEEGGGVGATWYSWDKKKEKTEPIGNAITYLEGSKGDKVDIGVIKIENAYWLQKGLIPLPPTIAMWKAGEETEPTAVPGQTNTGVGKATCISGGAIGTACGTVKRILLADQGVENLVEVGGVATKGGDSGAPWYSSSEEKLKFFVEGTHDGLHSETLKPIFDPIAWSLEQLITKIDLQILKTENEKRPACPMN